MSAKHMKKNKLDKYTQIIQRSLRNGRFNEILKGDRLKAKAARGLIWTIIGYGCSQIIRLGSNLILTRILFPEAFGVMAIIQVFLQGMSMVSDLGIRASIIQNSRGNDIDFLNTAWTIQIIRGFVVFSLICAISVPVAAIYDAPELVYLLPVAGLSTIISGFIPTKIQVANRNLMLGPLTLIELSSSLLAVFCMVSLALWTHSIWSLVFGGLAGHLFKLILVWKCVSGGNNALAWDGGSVEQIIHFGKWIFVGSLLGFFASQGDKLILAGYMTKAELGVYSVAIGISSMFLALHSKINQLVFFPIYSHFKDLSARELRPKILGARLAMFFILIPPLIILMIFGNEIIGKLYDERYRDAGWMVRILCVGYAVSIGTNIGPFYLAQGNSKLMTLLTAVKATIFVVSMLVGGELFGVIGVLVGTVVSHILFYFVETSVYRYYGLWIWKLDVIFLLAIFYAAQYCFFDTLEIIGIVL